MNNIKLFLVNVLREDGKAWQKVVVEQKEEEFIVCEFNGPVELVDQHFYISNIKYVFNEIESDQITTVGNNKKW